ncbi:hypothetical protein F5Y14DRAFT_359747 [Nemania sp. NC0429]|nr:hypothetical protein F5Y14DRAFT_359747 [Nemania sp. NC0429]
MSLDASLQVINNPSSRRVLTVAWAVNQLSPDRQKLLDAFSTFDGGSIPGHLFIHIPWSPGDQPKTSLVPSIGDWHQALTDLESASLIVRAENHGLRVHEIVRDCVLASMQQSPEKIEHALAASVAILKQAWPLALSTGVGQGHDHSRWTQCLLLYPHIISVKETYALFEKHTFSGEILVDLAKLLSEAAWYRYQLGLSSSAFDIIDWVRRICQHTSIDTFRLESDVLGTRTNLALDLADPLRSYDYAAAWLELESDAYKETKVPTAEFAAANNSMGIALACCERFEEANKHLLYSKSLRESLPGFKVSQNFSPLLALGITAWLQGKHQEAKHHLKTALKDREQEFGVDDKVGMRCGILYAALGNVYWSLQKLGKSEKYHRRALAQLQGTGGDEHFNTAHARYKVACHKLLSARQQSQQYYAILGDLESASRVYSTNEGWAPHHARCLYQASLIHSELGSVDDALEFGIKAKEELEKSPLFTGKLTSMPVSIKLFDAVVPWWAK